MNKRFSLASILLLLSTIHHAGAFTPAVFGPATTLIPTQSQSTLATTKMMMMMMMDPTTFSEAVSASYATTSMTLSSSSLMVAETEAWVAPVAAIMDPLLNFMSFAMLCRVVLSWYPNTNLNDFPFVVVAWPTQGLLRAVRDLVPPAFGVDITPIFWLAIFTFIHEILLGQQGLFTLKIKYGI